MFLRLRTEAGRPRERNVPLPLISSWSGSLVSHARKRMNVGMKASLLSAFADNNKFI
jgi:hypothetical protein